jgi:DNA-binding HxlR family transcriptional regulator
MPRSSRSSSPRRSARRSDCPIACALDLFGDRWTFLVIRDLFAGKSRYAEFLASGEGIPTNILANRLVRLEEAGIITRELYQRSPPRYDYALAPKGTALRSVLAPLAMWSKRYLPGIELDAKVLAALKTKSQA